MFDEFAIWKGTPFYQGAFYPPTYPYSIEGNNVLYRTDIIDSPDNPLIVKKEDAHDITSDITGGDFCITVDFYLKNLFQWREGLIKSQEYPIVGQWSTDGNERFWKLYLLINEDYSIDVKFSAGEHQYQLANVSHSVVIDWSSFSGGVATNLSDKYINFTISRKDDEFRIFVNGYYSDASETSDQSWPGFASLGTIDDDMSVMGEPGSTGTFQYYSERSVKDLLIFDNAYYWDDFGVPDPSFLQLTGFALFPRISGRIIVGNLSDTRGKIPIKLRMKGDIQLPVTMTGSLPIPLMMKGNLLFSGYADDYGQMNVTIPMLQPTPLDAFFEGIVSAYEKDFNFALPMLNIDMAAEINEVGSLNIGLPMVLFSGDGQDNTIGQINITLPSLIGEFEGITGQTGALDITLPMLTTSWNGLGSVEGTVDITIPIVKMSFGAVIGASGGLDITIPMPLFAFSGVVSAEGKLTVSIPMLKFFTSTDTGDDYESMVVNIKNKALTEYANYNYNSMCSFNGKNIGAKEDGLYELAGETDSGDPIEWSFQTGYINLMRLSQAWFYYKSKGDLMLTVILPDGREFEYDLTSYSDAEYASRVKIGKGIKTKYALLKLSNVDGSPISLDYVKLKYSELEPLK